MDFSFTQTKLQELGFIHVGSDGNEGIYEYRTSKKLIYCNGNRVYAIIDGIYRPAFNLADLHKIISAFNSNQEIYKKVQPSIDYKRKLVARLLMLISDLKLIDEPTALLINTSDIEKLGKLAVLLYNELELVKENSPTIKHVLDENRTKMEVILTAQKKQKIRR